MLKEEKFTDKDKQNDTLVTLRIKSEGDYRAPLSQKQVVGQDTTDE